MTADELRSQFNTAYKIITRERRMREVVLANSPKRDEKLREMDRLLEIVTGFKDELKQHTGNAPEQATLIDVPRKAEYA
jgi:hypothetical protein